MRPDQHKKKRSSDYKKKHGVENKRKGDAEKGAVNLVRNDGESSEFKKKDIESNWERYGEISDDDDNQGEDYSVLVSRGGDASSHIKLAGEEEWDAELKFDTFDIDYQKLARQLSKLSFSERYQLNKLEISPDISTYFSDNDRSEKVCETTKSDSSSIGRPTFISKVESSDLGFTFSPKVSKAPEASKESTGADHTDPQAIKNFNIPQEGKDCFSDSISMAAETKTQSEDDNLLDELIQSADTRKTQGEPCDHEEEVLAKLVVMSSGVDQADNQGGTTDEVEDLEDWLDSIL